MNEVNQVPSPSLLAEAGWFHLQEPKPRPSHAPGLRQRRKLSRVGAQQTWGGGPGDPTVATAAGSQRAHPPTPPPSPQSPCAWAELHPERGLPSPTAGEPRAPPPRSQGDVRPLDRAPAPPLPAALGACDSAVGAEPLRGRAGAASSAGIQALEWWGLSRRPDAKARRASRRGSGLLRRHTCPAARTAAAPAEPASAAPAGSRGAQPASAVHLGSSQPIACDCSGRTSRDR